MALFTIFFILAAICTCAGTICRVVSADPIHRAKKGK